MSGHLLRTTVRTSSHLYRIGAATTPLLPPFPMWNGDTQTFVEISNVKYKNFMRGEVRGCNLFSEPVWAGRRRHVWRTKSTELLLPAGLGIAHAANTPFAVMQTIVCAENQTIPHKDYLQALMDMEDQFVLCEIDELRTGFAKNNLAIPEVVDPTEHEEEVPYYAIWPPESLVTGAIWERCQNWYKGHVVLGPSEEPNDIPLMQLLLRFDTGAPEIKPEVKYEHFFKSGPESAFFGNSPAVGDRLIPQWMPFLKAATRVKLAHMKARQDYLLVRMDEKWPHYEQLLEDEAYMDHDIGFFQGALREVHTPRRSIANCNLTT